MSEPLSNKEAAILAATAALKRLKTKATPSTPPAISVTKLREFLRPERVKEALGFLAMPGAEGLVINRELRGHAVVAFGSAFNRTLDAALRESVPIGVVYREAAPRDVASTACLEISAILKREQEPVIALREIQAVINTAREHYKSLIPS